MALQPADLAASRKQNLEEFLKKLEAYVDGKLRTAYIGGTFVMAIQNGCFCQEVVKAVKEKYTGWDVSYLLLTTPDADSYLILTPKEIA